jgi:hypothetical protein
MSIDPDVPTPAEQELLALLEVLRAEGLEPTEALAEAVMRTVEWQMLVRSTIVLIGDLVGSMAAMLTLFLSNPPQGPREEA